MNTEINLQEKLGTTTSVKEGQIIYRKSKDFNEHPVVLENIVECCGVVFRLKNNDSIIYHRYLNDSKQSLMEHLREFNVKPEDIQTIQIFGGNINNRCYPHKDTIISGYNITQTGEDFFTPYLKEQRRNLIFRIDEQLCNKNGYGPDFLKDIPSPEKILSNKEVVEYDKIVIEKLGEIKNLSCSYGPFTFQPKYQDFCGPQNVAQIKKMTEQYGIPKEKIEEHRTPFGSHILITKDGFSIPKTIERDTHYGLRIGTAESKSSEGGRRLNDITGPDVKENPIWTQKGENNITLVNIPEETFKKLNKQKQVEAVESKDCCNIM